MTETFSRSAALLGASSMRRLAAARVLIVGVGGVGSWCAEALVRTGLGRIVLMDDDCVVASNLNRQCPATLLTLGRPKVEAMAERLRMLSPSVEVVALDRRFETADDFPLGGYDLVVDAIDCVGAKAELILGALAANVPLLSSMGAALRTDPTQVRVSRFEKVEGDGLAKALRQRFKKLERFPAGRFCCVWSSEVPQRNAGRLSARQQDAHQTIECSNDQAIPKGSLMTVTATFGMTLAAEAIRILTTEEQ